MCYVLNISIWLNESLATAELVSFVAETTRDCQQREVTELSAWRSRKTTWTAKMVCLFRIINQNGLRSVDKATVLYEIPSAFLRAVQAMYCVVGVGFVDGVGVTLRLFSRIQLSCICGVTFRSMLPFLNCQP